MHASPTTASSDDASSLVRAALLLDRFLIGCTAVADQVFGSALTGNSDVLVLAHLHQVGRARPSELVALTNLRRTNVARLVDRLEHLGFVERHHGDRDRRTVFASLSRSGRRQVVEFDRRLGHHLAAALPELREVAAAWGIPRDPIAPPDVAQPQSLEVLMGIVVAVEAIARRVDELGVHGRSARMALSWLAVSHDARPSELSAVTGLTSGGTSKVLDQLERLELIERRNLTMRTDRRAVLVIITPEGERRVRQMAGICAEHADDVRRALASALARAVRP